jgi:hypothetical protein
VCLWCPPDKHFNNLTYTEMWTQKTISYMFRHFLSAIMRESFCQLN